MSKESYIKEMLPWAKKAQDLTGLPYDYIVAQWGWETGWGTNRGSKTLNNHAGIKYSKYAPAGTVPDGSALNYAKYNSLDTFIKDYARVMNLSYYKEIKSARNDTDRIKALNKSPYSESDYDINTMLSAQNIAKQYGEGVTLPPPPKNDLGGDSEVKQGGISIPSLAGMERIELEQWAGVGIALFMLISMMPTRKPKY